MPRFPSAQGRVNHEPDSTLAVTKTCPKDGVHLSGTDANETVLPNYSYTITYSVTGWPGGVVRGGTSPEGLPIGVQIVGQPGREDVACGSGVLGTRVGGMATSSRRRPGSKNGSSVNHETRLVLLMVPYS